MITYYGMLRNPEFGFKDEKSATITQLLQRL